MKQEYELIAHQEMNFKIFLVNLLYRTPHIHKDFEISVILRGEITAVFQNRSFPFKEKGFFVTSPFQSHELKSDRNATILSLQVPAAFFASYYPRMNHVDFLSPSMETQDEETAAKIRRAMVSLACAFLKKNAYYELKCASLINTLFDRILRTVPYRLLNEKERSALRSKTSRMRKIIDYIDGHFSEKLLLKDIAERESLSLSYLSHFFKDYFGATFQEYLSKVRCEKARQLLLRTNDTLLDVCIACGFSDAKYFNSHFLRQYGSTPKEYRNHFHRQEEIRQRTFLFTTQEFLSEEESLKVLQQFVSRR